MIAVSIVVIALMLVSIDLNEDIFRKTFLVSVVIVILGIGASIALLNPIVGLIINIIIIFSVVNQTVDNYKPPMYFPFIISYVFMLMSSPANLNDLPLRIVSILVGSVYVLLIQLVLNKDRFKKTILGTRSGIIFNITKQIDNILNDTYNESLNIEVDSLVNTSVKAIYDTKSKAKYVTEKNKGHLHTSLCLQNLSTSLLIFQDEEFVTDEEKEFLIELKSILKLVNEYFSSSLDKKLILEKIDLTMNNLNENIKNENFKNIVQTLDNITEYLKLTDKHTDKSLWKNDLIISNVLKRIDTKSLSFKFALKLSLSLSITIFLVSIFDLTYGRWMIFTMLSIIQPHYDGTSKKAMHRVLGTLIGIIIFTVIFSIIKDNTIRLNITLLAAYIGIFVGKYQYSTSIVAISALGSVAIGGGGVEILGFRLLFTFLGCVVAMIINRYVLHYKIIDSIQDLILEYEKEMEELKNMNYLKENENERYSLIINTKLMEHKINLYNKNKKVI